MIHHPTRTAAPGAPGAVNERLGVEIAREQGHREASQPRPLPVICQDTATARCPCCPAVAGEACTEAGGYHLARFAAACQQERLTAADFAYVARLAGPVSSTATVVRPVAQAVTR